MCFHIFTFTCLQERKNEREAMRCKGEKRERAKPPYRPRLLGPPIARHLPHYNLHFTARCPLCAAFLFGHTISENSCTESGDPQEAFCLEARPQRDRQRYLQRKTGHSGAAHQVVSLISPLLDRISEVGSKYSNTLRRRRRASPKIVSLAVLAF